MNGNHLMVEKNILLEKTENEMKCKDKNEINKKKTNEILCLLPLISFPLSFPYRNTLTFLV